MRTNILVQYKGGGYDGCIWEWNFFFIDKQGTFHNIAASGTGGIRDLKGAMNLLENNGNSFSTQVFVYCLDNEEDMKSFATESACPHVLGVIRWFNNHNDPDAEPFAICSECGCKIVDANEIQLIDIHGCGGIESTADNLLCSECYTARICDCCGEYVGTDDTTYLGGEYSFDDDDMNKAARVMLDAGYTDVCQYCIAEEARQIEEEDHDDLLWSSLATGEPDLFSDEMRWLWTD